MKWWFSIGVFQSKKPLPIPLKTDIILTWKEVYKMNYYKYSKPVPDMFNVSMLIDAKGSGKPYSKELHRLLAVHWLCWYKYGKKTGNDKLAKDNLSYFLYEIRSMFH